MDVRQRFNGGSYEEAAGKAAEHFGVTAEQLNIERLPHSGGLFSFRKKEFIVEAWPKEPPRQEEAPPDPLPLPKGRLELRFEEEGVFLELAPPIPEGKEALLRRLARKDIDGLDSAALGRLLNGKSEREQIAPPQQERLIDEAAAVSLSDDAMEAFVTLLPPDGGRLLRPEEILERLSAAGVAVGIDEEALIRLMRERPYNIQTRVAAGQAMVEAQPGRYEFHFRTESSDAPKVLEDGTVDYMNLDNIENVTKGQLLVTVHPPVPGTDGYTVRGAKLPTKPGKVLPIPKGRNVAVEENRVYAGIDGRVEFSNRRVSVMNVMDISGDVGHSTGNINFNGTVRVSGGVITRFSIIASGSVEINGVVEGATIEAGGDVILRTGIQGASKGTIKAGGSVTARFIENATVLAAGVIRSEAIIHSRVESQDRVLVSGRKGMIVGGAVRGLKAISAVVAGSPSYSATVLEVGVSPELRSRVEQLGREKTKLTQEIYRLNQLNEAMLALARRGTLAPDKKETADRVAASLSAAQEKLLEIEMEQERYEEQLTQKQDGRIHIRGVIYPNTRIALGGMQLSLEKEYSFTTFKVRDGEIVTVPFEYSGQ